MKTMMPRGPHEPHRTATPLELFFDLAYVVPIAQAGLGLHHAKAEGAERRGTGITSRSGYSLLGGAISIILPAAAALILASAAGPYSMQATAVLIVGSVVMTRRCAWFTNS